MSKSVLVTPTELRSLLSKAFHSHGLSLEDANTIADCLTWANLRGIDTHGAIRTPFYLDLLRNQKANPRPSIRAINQFSGVLAIDGDGGLGPVVMNFATAKAIAIAKQTGIAWVLVRDTRHTGAVSYYTREVARAGMAGIYLGAGIPNMAYHGARKASLSTNPIAIAVPAQNGKVISLDMTTATVGRGTLMLNKELGKPLQPGWALDSDGNPTLDPHKAATALPLGGPKGSGLSLMIECLTSLLVNEPLISASLSATKAPHRQNALIAVINIESFTSTEQYQTNVGELASAIKRLPPAAGFDEILLPGERGDGIAQERRKSGIPIQEKTLEAIRKVTAVD